MSWRALATVVLAWSAAAGVARAQPEIELALRREPGAEVAWGVARAEVAAPTAQVVQILEDYGAYAEFFPGFTASRVLGRRGGRASVYVETMCIGGEHWLQLAMTSHRASGGGAVIQAHMVRGSPTRFDVRWTLVPRDRGNRTFVILELISDAEVPVPIALIDAHNRAAARMGIESLRRRTAAFGHGHR